MLPMNFEKIILALDTSDPKVAEEVTDELRNSPITMKVGLEMATQFGVDQAIRFGSLGGASIFLDLKFHDIPATVAGACRAATNKKITMLNVHCLGGPKMLAAARKAVDETCEMNGREQKPLLLGVTILTSHSYEELAQIGLVKELNIHDPEELERVQTMYIEEAVRRLAYMADDNGLDGLICSPKELVMLRKYFGDRFVYVTPGVRPAWAEANDQARIMKPGEAILAGADYVVIGRPILKPKPPLSRSGALELIAQEIAEALAALNPSSASGGY